MKNKISFIIFALIFLAFSTFSSVIVLPRQAYAGNPQQNLMGARPMAEKPVGVKTSSPSPIKPMSAKTPNTSSGPLLPSATPASSKPEAIPSAVPSFVSTTIPPAPSLPLGTNIAETKYASGRVYTRTGTNTLPSGTYIYFVTTFYDLPGSPIKEVRDFWPNGNIQCITKYDTKWNQTYQAWYDQTGKLLSDKGGLLAPVFPLK